MQARLIDLWARAMRNQDLDTGTRAHIEHVLNLEFITVERRHAVPVARLRRLPSSVPAAQPERRAS